MSEVSTSNIVSSRTRSGRSLIKSCGKVFREARKIYNDQLFYLNEYSREKSNCVDTGRKLSKSHLMAKCAKLITYIQTVVSSYVDHKNMDDLIVYTELLTWEQRLSTIDQKVKEW